MPHDKNGNRLTVGALVTLACVITAVHEGETQCNVTAEAVERPEGEAYIPQIAGNSRFYEAVQEAFLSGNSFRKKPIVIEAYRVPDYNKADSIVAYVHECCRLAEWCGGTSHMMNDADSGRQDHVLIPTLEGDMKAKPGDWIIKGVKGEFYPCKPDIFAATYEAAQA